MLFLYNLALLFLRIGYFVAGFFYEKAKAFRNGRKGLFKKLHAQLGANPVPTIWVHCASLGEFEQARPVIEKFKIEFPSHKILLTFFSPSGFEIRKNYEKADNIFYLPWDTHKNAVR